MNRNHNIRAHYEEVWQRKGQVCQFNKGKVNELSPEFMVLEFAPTDTREYWTYATCSMSNHDDAVAMELHIHSNVRGEASVELLFMTAHFHRTACNLDLHHTVNFGKPWTAESNCQFGLISQPYLDGPSLEQFQIFNQSARALWLLPITLNERDFKMLNGIDALESLFEAKNVDYANPLRVAVC